MADDNKPVKYARYAIGEIVLVVIGILIALQVNNWNEDRKDRKLERKLLKEVYKSIQTDTTSLNWESDMYQSVLDHAKFIKAKFDEAGPYDKRLDTSFAIVSNGYVTEADYTPFDRIVDIGVDIITNDSLRKQLIAYYDDSRHLKEVEAYFENSKYFRQHIYPKYFKSYRHSTEAIPADYEALKNSNDFNVALDYCINDAIFFRYYSIRRKGDALMILDLLKKELHTDE